VAFKREAKLMTAVYKNHLPVFLRVAFALGAALFTGWCVAAWLWLQSQSRGTERPLYFAIVAFCACPALLVAPRDARLRLLVMVALGMIAGRVLGPSSSASFDSRASRLFSDPGFAFAPTSSAFGAFVFGCVGYYLPHLRRMLNSVNHNATKQMPPDGQSAK